jgi:transcriptional regulator with XRE-family HTH domain
MLREKSKDNIIKEVREYLGLTLEEFARAVGVSTYTVWRWENGITDQPTIEHWRKIINLIKKKGNKEYKEDFLKWVIYDKLIPTWNKSEKELIVEIEKNQQEFIKSPIMQKVFQENPELRNLPFKEIFKRYTKNKISLNASILLNSLQIYPPKRGRPRKTKRNKAKNNIKSLKRKSKVKGIPKRRHKRKGKNQNKSKENTGEDGSDGEPAYYEVYKSLEAKYNLIEFLNLLLKIDTRLNPEKYKRKS